MKHLLGVLTLTLVSTSAFAGFYNPVTEQVVPTVTETFGVQHSGSASLDSTIIDTRGAYAFSSIGTLRYFDGGAGGTQSPGSFTLAAKNGTSFDIVSDYIPNKGPAVGTALQGGGTFDGTALWLTDTMFKPKHAPAIGTYSPGSTGTYWDGTVGPADTGADWCLNSSSMVSMALPRDTTTKGSYVSSFDVYVPSHNGDALAGSQNVRATSYNFWVGPYLERDEFSLQSAGGIGGDPTLSVSTDAWHKVDVRMDFTVTTQGPYYTYADYYASGHGPTDNIWNHDSGSVLLSYYVDGALIRQRTQVLDQTSMRQRPADTPISFSAGGGIIRGCQGSAPELYIDNIMVGQIQAAPILGDADHNGKVDFNDYLVLESSFGGPPSGVSNADFDNSGKVDFIDYLALESNFGYGAGVPEPMTLTLLGLGGLAIIRRR